MWCVRWGRSLIEFTFFFPRCDVFAMSFYDYEAQYNSWNHPLQALLVPCFRRRSNLNCHWRLKIAWISLLNQWVGECGQRQFNGQVFKWTVLILNYDPLCERFNGRNHQLLSLFKSSIYDDKKTKWSWERRKAFLGNVWVNAAVTDIILV